MHGCARKILFLKRHPKHKRHAGKQWTIGLHFLGQSRARPPAPTCSFHSRRTEHLRDGVTGANKPHEAISWTTRIRSLERIPFLLLGTAKSISAGSSMYSTHRGQTDPVFGYLWLRSPWPGTSVRMLSRLTVVIFWNRRLTLEAHACVREHVTAAERTRLFQCPDLSASTGNMRPCRKRVTPSSWTRNWHRPSSLSAEC